ncbi:hypothetical protein H696_03096 [Fonticula alba]|uniref:L-type lectin-like domain-containing protein n=1 Tax=Fonticula alba TaxID=691883 RepID=A0A058Z8Z3_FONAL|nr:hypothetical protein H696_03096 [Fonticula alba]KCV70745.1 hypothetical protein H696_03096 [Fonticula alba]|eukprot:XP_009495261.1 hypothetical protein H696_03096 [Fonticula alba]
MTPSFSGAGLARLSLLCLLLIAAVIPFRAAARPPVPTFDSRFDLYRSFKYPLALLNGASPVAGYSLQGDATVVDDTYVTFSAPGGTLYPDSWFSNNELDGSLETPDWESEIQLRLGNEGSFAIWRSPEAPVASRQSSSATTIPVLKSAASWNGLGLFLDVPAQRLTVFSNDGSTNLSFPSTIARRKATLQCSYRSSMSGGVRLKVIHANSTLWVFWAALDPSTIDKDTAPEWFPCGAPVRGVHLSPANYSSFGFAATGPNHSVFSLTSHYLFVHGRPDNTELDTKRAANGIDADTTASLVRLATKFSELAASKRPPTDPAVDQMDADAQAPPAAPDAPVVADSPASDPHQQQYQAPPQDIQQKHQQQQQQQQQPSPQAADPAILALVQQLQSEIVTLSASLRNLLAVVSGIGFALAILVAVVVVKKFGRVHSAKKFY